MEVVRANSYLRQVLDLDSSRFPTGNGNERNIWAKNAPSQLLFASAGALYVTIHLLLLVFIQPNAVSRSGSVIRMQVLDQE